MQIVLDSSRIAHSPLFHRKFRKRLILNYNLAIVILGWQWEIWVMHNLGDGICFLVNCQITVEICRVPKNVTNLSN